MVKSNFLLGNPFKYYSYFFCVGIISLGTLTVVFFFIIVVVITWVKITVVIYTGVVSTVVYLPYFLLL